MNIAYEAATVDLNDVNMIDPFHLEEYGEIAVNYNRDIEAFPYKKNNWKYRKNQFINHYRHGVNRVGFGITDDEVVKEASQQEIIEDILKLVVIIKKGNTDLETFKKSWIYNAQFRIKRRG